jgi:benzodiazapine receptor
MNAINQVAQYGEYIKPDWAPPSSVFGPVWTILYLIIAVTFGYVFYNYFRGKVRNRIVLPFLLNLVFNLAYTPIMFRLHNMMLASVDIVLVLITLIWAMAMTWKKKSWVAYANIPYLLWVMFATALQLTILYLNT